MAKISGKPQLTEPCPCQSGRPFASCCAPYLTGAALPPTAVALMRSRYSAYVCQDSAYLRQTWHPSTCPPSIEFTAGVRWLGLKILETSEGQAEDQRGTVTFRARFKLPSGQGQALLEHSYFQRVQGRWFYVGEVVETDADEDED